MYEKVKSSHHQTRLAMHKTQGQLLLCRLAGVNQKSAKPTL